MIIRAAKVREQINPVPSGGFGFHVEQPLFEIEAPGVQGNDQWQRSRGGAVVIRNDQIRRLERSVERAADQNALAS